MLVFILLLKVMWILAAEDGQHWTYEGPHGQDHWPASYPECGSNAQSPINIQTDSVTFDPELLPLQPHGYEQPGTEPLDLHNNGHTVQLSLPPTLHLEGLPRKYVAAQLHLHWGQKGSPGGSEHKINGEATAAELHIVHYDSESYASLSEAAQQPQGLAVLGILVEVGETENPAYEHILSHLHEIRHKGEPYKSILRSSNIRLQGNFSEKASEAWNEAELGTRGVHFWEPCLVSSGAGRARRVLVCSHPDQRTSVPPFNVRGLLPPLLAQFFRYNGSLTTPPCYQSVLWTVFNRRAQISMGQVSGGEVRLHRHSCHRKLSPTPPSKYHLSLNPTLSLLSWKSFRRHCSPLKRSRLSSWYRTTEPPSLSTSE
uniref:carbonic anhydrase n=1 Tax=Sus scrofa TaxID=9823 RepID=A0A8D1A664_PIG